MSSLPDFVKIPQRGDRLMYVRDGHVMWEKAKMPELQNLDVILDRPQYMPITVMSSALLPDKSVLLEVQPISRSIPTFKIDYLPAFELTEFLVPLDLFRRAELNQFYEGQPVTVYYPDQGEHFPGKVVQVKPGTKWNNVGVEWEDGEVDWLCHWEVQPKERPKTPPLPPSKPKPVLASPPPPPEDPLDVLHGGAPDAQMSPSPPMSPVSSAGPPAALQPPPATAVAPESSSQVPKKLTLKTPFGVVEKKTDAEQDQAQQQAQAEAAAPAKPQKRYCTWEPVDEGAHSHFGNNPDRRPLRPIKVKVVSAKNRPAPVSGIVAAPDEDDGAAAAAAGQWHSSVSAWWANQGPPAQPMEVDDAPAGDERPGAEWSTTGVEVPVRTSGSTMLPPGYFVEPDGLGVHMAVRRVELNPEALGLAGAPVVVDATFCAQEPTVVTVCIAVDAAAPATLARLETAMAASAASVEHVDAVRELEGELAALRFHKHPLGFFVADPQAVLLPGGAQGTSIRLLFLGEQWGLWRRD